MALGLPIFGGLIRVGGGGPGGQALDGAAGPAPGCHWKRISAVSKLGVGPVGWRRVGSPPASSSPSTALCGPPPGTWSQLGVGWRRVGSPPASSSPSTALCGPPPGTWPQLQVLLKSITIVTSRSIPATASESIPDTPSELVTTIRFMLGTTARSEYPIQKVLRFTTKLPRCTRKLQNSRFRAGMFYLCSGPK